MYCIIHWLGYHRMSRSQSHISGGRDSFTHLTERQVPILSTAGHMPQLTRQSNTVFHKPSQKPEYVAALWLVPTLKNCCKNISTYFLEHEGCSLNTTLEIILKKFSKIRFFPSWLVNLSSSSWVLLWGSLHTVRKEIKWSRATEILRENRKVMN